MQFTKLALLGSIKGNRVRQRKEYSIKKIIQTHPLSFMIVVFMLCVLVMNLMTGQSLIDQCLQTAVLSAILILAVALYNKRRVLSPHILKSTRGARGAIVFLLAVAVLTGGTLLVLGLNHGESIVEDWLVTTALFTLLCFLTGISEEGLFRGVMFSAMSNSFGRAKNSAFKAALISAAIFGILHVSQDLAVQVKSSPIILMQVILKPVQAAMFGFIMAGLYQKSQNFWCISALHGLYNVLTMTPGVLFTGVVPLGHLTGSIADFAVLVASLVLYVTLVVIAAKWLRDNRSYQEKKRPSW